MKVILLKDVEGYGTIGDIVQVKDGFANNYLIPRGLALRATPSNVKHVQSILQQKAKKLQKEKEKAEKLAKELEGLVVSIKRKVGEKGKLFGSVTVNEIAQALQSLGYDVDRKKILLKNPIKEVGMYTVAIKLHPEIVVNIKVDVQPE
ncbi:50S ribosomal protein L9 [Thermocrinis minervae]|uniref:Large ribosomal subunit protein bL9 n=1 Tax=Thermocrinis minervae TaxID=381751 RepID=A0A1M6S8K4_9AQUI|nr:50S ribosomal protein L9 [Thermocrinis minervae]SHK41063.1 LSU ribosomal protein L9P [Thermocrinis minervae]